MIEAERGVIQLRPVTGIHGMREKGISGQPFMHRLQLVFRGHAYRLPVSHAVDGNPAAFAEGLTLRGRHGKIISVIDYVEDSIWRVW